MVSYCLGSLNSGGCLSKAVRSLPLRRSMCSLEPGSARRSKASALEGGQHETTLELEAVAMGDGARCSDRSCRRLVGAAFALLPEPGSDRRLDSAVHFSWIAGLGS